MADEYSLYQSLQSQDNEFEFSSRQYTYIPDSNNGSYPSGSIIFDLASLANSGKMWSPQQSFIVLPIVMTAVINSAITATAENVFAMSLKSHVFHLINSLSVEITNNQVVNLTSYSNLDINYRLLSSLDLGTVQNMGQSIIFGKDNAESITYNASANATGVGECNNVIKDAVLATTAGYTGAYGVNKGRYERMKLTSFDPNASLGVLNSTLCNTVGKHYATQGTTLVQYNLLATIPLRFLHDIFNKLPLTKGMYVRLILNTNAVSNCSITVATSAYSTYSTTSVNGVLPFMVSPISTSAGTGFNLGTNSVTNITCSMGIGKSFNGSQSHPIMSTCRVYNCMYEFSPLVESRYFSQMPNKKILYNDILSFQVLNIGAGQTFSQLLSNSISRLRYLLICPQLASVANGVQAITSTSGGLGTPMNSPFSSSPATCCPYAQISSFNVLLSGSALYQSNYTYRFEEFLQEIRSSNSLNGGLAMNLSSGLLSQSDFENGYGFVYVNLQRKVSQAQDDVARSLQIIGTNSTLVSMDYYVIVGYEREITINTSTGSLVV